MESNDKYIGRFLDNRYEILEKIGEGGMALVYKARCHRLNRYVAVKILKEDLARDAEFRRRFQAESQAVAMLSHPNIVAVYDVSKTGDTEYIVMELIEGITLKQYITRKGALSWKETLHFATQICKALSHAHSRGIVHRDIKPHNIMLLKDGSVKVADFGVARLQSKQHTLTQQALGSVHYISPEQAKGAAVDTRSDLYSLGVVMYELLTGRVPFDGESAVSVAIQHINAKPVFPRELNPDIPEGLEDITMHAMDPDLERRYRSADEILRDLEEFRKNPDTRFGYAKAMAADGEKEAAEAQNGQMRHTRKPAKPRTTHPAGQRLTAEEYRKRRKKAARTTMLVGIFGVAVVIIALFLLMWPTLRGWFDPQEQRVTMPNFVGNYLDLVEKNSEYQSLYVFSVEYMPSSEYPAGYILDQSPAANRQLAAVSEGIQVTLTVSSGADTVYMPNLINTDYREAKNKLESLQMNLTVELIPVADDNVTSGYVIEQVPGFDELLTEGMTVFLTYSTGPDVPMVNVPDVEGLSLEQAIERLESYNLSYTIEYQDSSEPKDKVVYQSVPAGYSVEIHTKIKLFVSNGPAESPSPTAGQG